jgi:predicted permease
MAWRTDLAAGVKEGGYGTLAPRKERFREAFIVGQIALGLVLANGAVLLVRSYSQVRNQEYGFRSEGVLTMALNPAGPRYQDDQAFVSYYDEILRNVNAVPGVRSAGTVSRLPLFGGSNGNVWVEGRPPRQNAGEGPLVEVVGVNGDYFRTMGISLVRGRLLQPGDSASGAVGVVINQALADEAWPGQDPLGKRFSFSDDPPSWLTVVGVVGDVRQWGPEQPPRGQAYFPFVRGWTASSYLTVRTDGDPSDLVPRIREAVLVVDPTQPPSNIRTMEARVERTFAQRRFYTTLIALFAAAALFLAAAGVYGTVSYFVTRRVRELGIRRALGSPRSGIVGLVLRRALRLAFWGVGLGLAGVWGTTSIVEGMVYGIDAVDPVTLVGGCLTLAAVAVAASGLPALKATRISPVLALRAE